MVNPYVIPTFDQLYMSLPFLWVDPYDEWCMSTVITASPGSMVNRWPTVGAIKLASLRLVISYIIKRYNPWLKMMISAMGARWSVTLLPMVHDGSLITNGIEKMAIIRSITIGRYWSHFCVAWSLWLLVIEPSLPVSVAGWELVIDHHHHQPSTIINHLVTSSTLFVVINRYWLWLMIFDYGYWWLIFIDYCY